MLPSNDFSEHWPSWEGGREGGGLGCEGELREVHIICIVVLEIRLFLNDWFVFPRPACLEFKHFVYSLFL